MTDTGNRYRLVTRQGSSEHVHSVVMNREEADEMLEEEREMHELTGWEVSGGEGLISARILVGGKRVTRVVFIRAYAPLEDVVQT